MDVLHDVQELAFALNGRTAVAAVEEAFTPADLRMDVLSM